MKQYTKPLPNTRTSTHSNESVDSNGEGQAAKRGTAGGFPIGTLTNTQILTDEWNEWRDNFLENCFKEWEQWLNDYEFRQAQRTKTYPYTPTDFS